MLGLSANLLQDNLILKRPYLIKSLIDCFKAKITHGNFLDNL